MTASPLPVLFYFATFGPDHLTVRRIESSIAQFVLRDMPAGVSVGPSDSKFLAHARCLFQGLNAVVPKVHRYGLTDRRLPSWRRMMDSNHRPNGLYPPLYQLS